MFRNYAFNFIIFYNWSWTLKRYKMIFTFQKCSYHFAYFKLNLEKIIQHISLKIVFPTAGNEATMCKQLKYFVIYTKKYIYTIL